MGAPVVPSMELLVVAIVILAIKLGRALVVGGLVKKVDPGKLEGPGEAIGTTLVARGVLLLGLLGCLA